MKKPNVLNRSMFNRGVTSAYGRGITSNLVSDKQRQRYNYGGRVGLRFGTPKIDYEDQYRIIDGNKIPKKYLDQEYPQPSFIPQVKEWWNLDEEDTGLPPIEDLQSEEYYGPTGNYLPYQIGTATGVRGSENPILARGTGEKGDVWIGDVGEEIQEFPELEQGGSSKLQVASELEAAKKAAEERALNVPIIDQAKNQEDAKLLTDDDIPRSRRLDSDLLDIEGIIDKYYDKKTPLGEAQLGLAGSVLAAGFEGDKKKAASILGGGVSKFGTTLGAQKKERSKLGATLEGQREIYRQSRIAEGEADIRLAERKAQLKAEGADTEDLTGVQSYLGSMTAWNKQNKEAMTGETHQDIIGSFDEELAGEAVVLHPKTIGIGDKAKTTMPEADQRKLNAAKDGDTLIIGEQIFIKDSSLDPPMRAVSFTDLKKLREATSKREKTYLDLAQGS